MDHNRHKDIGGQKTEWKGCLRQKFTLLPEGWLHPWKEKVSFPFFPFPLPFWIALTTLKNEKKKIISCESVGKPGQYILVIFSRDNFFLIFFSKNFLNELTVYVKLRQNPNFAMPSLMNKINKNKGCKTPQPESMYLNRSSCLQRVPGEEQTNCSHSKYLWNSLLSVCFNW